MDSIARRAIEVTSFSATTTRETYTFNSPHHSQTHTFTFSHTANRTIMACVVLVILWLGAILWTRDDTLLPFSGGTTVEAWTTTTTMRNFIPKTHNRFILLPSSSSSVPREPFWMLLGAATNTVQDRDYNNHDNNKINNNINNNSGTHKQRTNDQDYQTRLAQLPQDLEAIRECRQWAFDMSKRRGLLPSQQSFVDVSAVVHGKALCVVAIGAVANSKDNQRSDLMGNHEGLFSSFLPRRQDNNNNKQMVLGTADLCVSSKGLPQVEICNVFVRPNQRGRGVGRALMNQAEVDVLAQVSNNHNTTSTTSSSAVQGGTRLWLSVDTQNKPAITLYKSLGYKADGIHGLVEGIAQLTGASLQIVMTKNIGE